MLVYGFEFVTIRQDRFVLRIESLGFYSLGFQLLEVLLLHLDIAIEVGGRGTDYF